MNPRPSTEPPPPGAFVIDGQFRVVRALDAGGMARIYLCSYLAGCLVAVKCLGRTAPQGASIVEMDDRFQRESEILLSLRHPAIVAAYTHGYDAANQLRYLVMEYVRGATLAELRRDLGRPLTAVEAAEILLPIADALAYCHRRSVFHRDVTPRNVLVTEDRGVRHAKLVDFGAGWRHDALGLTGPVVFGSLDFQPLDRLAPEHRHRVDDAHQASIDVYGLAAVAWFLSAGEGPEGALLTMEEKLGSTRLVAGPDDRWNRLLALALRREPGARLGMAAFREELKSWVDVNETMMTEPFVQPFWAREPTADADRSTPEPPPLAAHRGTYRSILSMPIALPAPRSDAGDAGGAPVWPMLGAAAALVGLLSLAGAAGLLATGQAVWRAMDAPSPSVARPPDPEPEPAEPAEPPPRPDPNGRVRDALAAAGVALRPVAAGTYTFGDGRLHVPAALLEPEWNWEGRTLHGKNPDQPWIALSPEHEVTVGEVELSAPLTWASWVALGGAKPTDGPCADDALDAPAACLSLPEIAATLAEASTRLGLTPALDPATGSWDGVADGLRPPTEAEWERAWLEGALVGGPEWVIAPEPLPDLPGPGAGTLRGHAVVRDPGATTRHRSFALPTTASRRVGVRLAWSPQREPAP